MIYNLAGLFGISFSIEQALRTMMGTILALIYSLIEYLYDVFIYLSKAQILDNEFIKDIYRKVGMILGIFMLFKLIFSLIQSLIDPNKFTDKKNGYAAIITRSIIAIVLLGVTPTIFKEAFKIQNIIVGGDTSDNVIYKLVAGKSTVGNISEMGRVIASDLYFSFFSDNDEPFLNEGSYDIMNYIDPSEIDNVNYDRFKKDDYDNLVRDVSNPESGKNFHDTVSYLALKDSITEQYVIEFNWIPLLVVGGFVVWILAMYCVQVAVRIVQLAYLQLIAPVPIISYITDPDGSFKKWTSQCVATFLDLFFRLAIIYFVVTMIGDVLNQFLKMDSIIYESTGMAGENWFTIAIIKIFIIIGLLLFAQKVPQLLQDLFPNLGKGAGKFSFGLNPKKEVFEPLKQTPVVGRLGAKAIGVAGKGAKWLGNKAVSPITNRYNNWKSDRKSAREVENLEKPGKKLFDRYGKDIENAFTNDEFRKSYLEKSDADKALKAAEAELEVARASGDESRISTAVNNRNEAQKRFSSAEKWHDNNRKKYGADARKEDSFKTFKSLNPHLFSNTQPAAQSASQPSSNSTSDISSERSDSVIDRVNNITGVNRSSASENGAPTAENSLMAQLAEQAHQQEMQQEFMNRNSSDPEVVVLPPTEQQMNDYINTPPESREFNYHSQEEWDKAMEFATEKLQELANNNASELEIEYQIKTLENLQEAKRQSAEKDRQSAENAQAADDQFRDGWMSQGGADDSDNW